MGSTTTTTTTTTAKNLDKEKANRIYLEIEKRFPKNDALNGVTRLALKELPIIDLKPFVENESLESKKKTAMALREACINLGFFYIKNHGISSEECQNALNWAKKLFDLPLKEKEKIATAGRSTFHGWTPVGAEKIGDRSEIEGDVKEKYDICRILELDDPQRELPIMGDTPWPKEDVLPGFKDFMSSHMLKRLDLSFHLLHAFALSLDLQEDYFDEDHRPPLDNMRLNYYPPVKPEDLNENLWSAAPHTDYAGFTILLQDKQAGLQVRNIDGSWIDATPVDGTFVINVADTMALWTNDLYQSTPHRVANFSGNARYSVPYFTGTGNPDPITCLATCTSESNPPRYAPITLMEYLTRRLMGYYSDEDAKEFKEKLEKASGE